MKTCLKHTKRTTLIMLAAMLALSMSGGITVSASAADALPVEIAVTAIQTVVGGSYNFAAVDLLGAGYGYEITSRPATQGGHIPVINYWNQFAFNPQGAPTNISRAGDYVVEASDNNGIVVAIFKITVLGQSTITVLERVDINSFTFGGTAAMAKMDISVTAFYSDDTSKISKETYVGAYAAGHEITLLENSEFKVVAKMKGFPAIYNTNDCFIIYK